MWVSTVSFDRVCISAKLMPDISKVITSLATKNEPNLHSKKLTAPVSIAVIAASFLGVFRKTAAMIGTNSTLILISYEKISRLTTSLSSIIKHSALSPIVKVMKRAVVTLFLILLFRSLHKHALIADNSESAVEATAIIITAEQINDSQTGVNAFTAVSKMLPEFAISRPAAFAEIPKYMAMPEQSMTRKLASNAAGAIILLFLLAKQRCPIS